MFNTELYILRYVQKHGGMTYRLYRGIARHKTGYYVSLKDYEKKIPYPELSVETIQDYIQDNWSILDLSSVYLGIWVDHGTVYFDVSKWVSNEKEALYFAQRQEQTAIWDCKNRRTLEII